MSFKSSLSIKHIKRFSKELVERFFEDKCQITAASLAFTTLFCVVPFLTITYTVFSLIPSFDGVSEIFQDFILDFIVPGKESEVKAYLETFTKHARELSSVGAAFLLVTVSLLLHETESTFNEIWGIDKGRSGLTTLVMYWTVISLGPVLLGAGFLLSSYVMSVEVLSVGPDLGLMSKILLSVMPIVLSALGFAFIYKAVPNTEVQFKHAVVGAVMVALLLEGAKSVFTIFVQLSPTYDFIYGTFAVFPLFLLWMYFCWLIILLGAEMVCHLERFYDPREEINYPIIIESMLILSELRKAYEHGEVVTRDRFVKATGYVFSEDHWNEHLSRMLKLGWVVRSEAGGYILSRSLSSITLYELYRKLDHPIPNAYDIPDMIEGPDTGWYEGLRDVLKLVNHRQRDVLGTSLKDVLSGRIDLKQ